MSVGYEHSCAVRTDNAVWCWGANDRGQLGDGNTTDRLVPVQIGHGSEWVVLDAGWYHTLALSLP